ncbi:MAG: hypothetical protein DM484_22950 [Candidatus Methylumidiphilus alinenensis]|uniref:Uncharacterized protein n=1 Tax=Candidatus Methylumidiphilus alinenensis TaxID=2202197 RepID=A0A2W4QQ74_9GAMM|nr:MAG: hypothetical protein DM484_22950 [Candidatus Methylumidiphilus alinenensis]
MWQPLINPIIDALIVVNKMSKKRYKTCQRMVFISTTHIKQIIQYLNCTVVWVRLKVMQTNRAVIEFIPGVQGLPCL